VYASSRAVYGSLTPPYTENLIDPLNLTTPYQITKMLGESYSNYFRIQHELPICCARFFNSFGPGEIPGQYRNVIPNFIYWALNKKSLPITGTGKETRDFTSVNDITNGLILMATKEGATGEAFNLGTGREIEIEYLAKLINEKTNNEAPIIFKPKRKWDSKNKLSASNEKAKRILGFNPDLDFESNIQETISWFKKNKKMIERKQTLISKRK
jgi:nucleoside-diphosphate-sugar epimerase